jgi:MFS transporter, DHA3 family, macrolide efflux protein
VSPEPGSERRSVPTFIASQVVNDIGTWISRVAVLAYAYGATHSGVVEVFVLIADALPRVVLSPRLGRAAGRIGLRRAAQLSNAVQAGLVLCVLAAAPHVWVMIALLAVKASFDALYQVSALGLFPRLVANPELLMRRNAMLNMSSAAILAVGPAAGGVVYAAAGLNLGLSIDAGSFVAAALLLGLLPDAKAPAPAARPTTARTARWREPALLIVVANGVAAAAGGVFNGAMPVFLQGTLRLGPRAFGASFAAFGAGALAILVLMTFSRGLPTPRRLFATALVGSAVTVGAFAVARRLWEAALVLFLIGLFSALRGTSARTVVQHFVREGDLSTLGLYQSFVSGGLLAGMGVAAALIAFAGARTVLLASIPLYAAAVLIAIAVSRITPEKGPIRSASIAP